MMKNPIILSLLLTANYMTACEVVPIFPKPEIMADNSSCVPYPTDPEPPLRCGGTFDSKNGTIFYKPYEHIENNERCVWSINTKSYSDGTTIRFNILYLGYPLSGNRSESSPRLDITGINLANNIMNDYTVNGTGQVDITSISSAVIIFSSGSGNTGKNFTGFILVFETFSFGGLFSSTFIQTPPVKFEYFKETDTSEILFIILPQNNSFPGPIYPIIYLENTPQSKYDRKKVYQFVRSSDIKLWDQVDEVDAGNDAIILSGQSDILLITSWADGYQVSRDFLIAHVRCRKPSKKIHRYVDGEKSSIPQMHI